MKNNIGQKSKHGISLIALIITIVVIIILAAAIIVSLFRDGGIIENARLAAFVNEMQQIQESVQVKISEEVLEKQELGHIPFDEKLKDRNDIEVVDTLKQEILYARSGMDEEYSPSDYDVSEFEIDEKIYIIDKKTGDNKKDTYIYDTESKIVFKIPPTEIGGKIYHSYHTAKNKKGNKPKEEVKYTIEDESGVRTVSGVTYYEPNLKGFNANTTEIVYYALDFSERTITASEYIEKGKPHQLENGTFYDYQNKIWANVKTNANGLEAWWVWIPRYAYKVEADNSISMVFVDTSNNRFDGQPLGDYTVHPSFTVDGKELKGIWMSKYHATFQEQVPTEEVLAPNMEGFDAENTYIELYDTTTQTFTEEVKLKDANLTTINNDKKWYDYKNKVWANIKTNANGAEAWWVWIPRYAYKIQADGTKSVLFVDLNNKPLDTVNYPTGNLPEGYTLHPAFTVDGKPLKGIWMSKYHATEE